jgi:hypothetical protein
MDAPTSSPSEPQKCQAAPVTAAPVTEARETWESFFRFLVVVLGIFLGAFLALFIALSAGWIEVGC